MNYDERGCDAVRRFIVDNALYWVTEYHFDGLRLDAVHGIFDSSTTHILAGVAAAVKAQESNLQREIHAIAESDLNDPRVVTSGALGGNDLDAQWSDDFHHSVHAYLTGERARYYEDYGDLADIEKALSDGFVYDRRYSSYRGKTYGASSVGLPGKKFVVCLQNHDQVGNRRDGARLGTLLGPSELRTAVGLLLLAPYLPLLFMGEEFGEVAPFLYFTSHQDPKLARAVTEGRKREFASGPSDEKEFADPQDRQTFERSKVDHSLQNSKENKSWTRYYSALIAMRKEHPALRSLDKECMQVRRIGRSLGMRRWEPGGEEVAAVYSLGDAAPGPDEFFDGEWKPIFDSEEWEPRAEKNAATTRGRFGLRVYCKSRSEDD